MLQGHPQVARDLLKYMPRLVGVSEDVNYQNKHFDGTGYPANAIRGENIPLGAGLLRVATDLEVMVAASNRPELAMSKICARVGHYDLQVVRALERHVGLKSDTTASPSRIGFCSTGRFHGVVAQRPASRWLCLFVVGPFAIPGSRTATLGRLLSGRSARLTANCTTALR
ncbi:MAG: hypothetical protein KDB05_18940 [Planctomycetales bacterium]|nr:hypothetical protein [Planctomycetales bacterium]